MPGSIWNIWEGGIAIFGALLGGAIGVYIGCRITGLRFLGVRRRARPGAAARAGARPARQLLQPRAVRPADRPAVGSRDRVDQPGYPGRLRRRRAVPPDVPLRDDLERRRAIVILLHRAHREARSSRRGRRCRRIRRPRRPVPVPRRAIADAAPGSGARCSALYLIWYGIGRSWFESIRLDPSETFFGIRSNVWGALAAIVLGIIIIVGADAAVTPGVEPSPYLPGSRVEGPGCGRLRRHLLGYRRRRR